MSGLVVLVVVIVVTALAMPRVGAAARRRRSERERASNRVRGLPGVVLLLQIVMAAGAPPRSAIATIAQLRTGRNELGTVVDDFAVVAGRLKLGADMTSAVLVSEATARQSRVARVLDVLRRAEIDGVAVGPHFELLVRELRRERALALDVAAQRLTISLLFPLVVCILPAFVLLAVVPLLLGALSNLPG